MVTLTITIIVLIILASVTTYSGVEAIQNAKYNNTIAQLKVMQTKVDELYEDYQNGDETIKTTILNQGTATSEKATELNNAYSVATNENINGADLGLEEDYRYYTKDYIKNNLDLDGINCDFFINIKARAVLLTEKLEYKNQNYYSLCQIEGELYSVKYIPEQIANMPEGWVKANKNNYANDWYAYKDTEGNIAKVNAPKLVEGMATIKYVGNENVSFFKTDMRKILLFKNKVKFCRMIF